MPTGLFLKIFLWFWLAMTVVGGTFVVSVLLTRPEPEIPRWREFVSNAVTVYVERSAEILENEGRRALRDYLERVQSNSGIRAAIFDSQGREVLGRRMPQGTRQLVARAQRSDRVMFRPAPGSLLAARTATAPSGRLYTLVGRFPRPLQGRPTELSDVLLRLLAVVMTGGVVCYGLARYLTSPVSRLQRATRQLAEGDLRTRVGLGLESRGDEFADLGKDFDLMAERIESLINSQRTLLSDISHELRSPLARLGVALELARKRAGDAAQASLDRIELEAERMNELIGQLLRLSRLESISEPSRRELVPLAELVKQVAADASFEAASRHRSVTVAQSTECVVRGSAELLRSAIENIVRNAVHYTAENTEVEIFLSLASDNGESSASIAITDHGPGVPESVLADLFRPFYRVSDARDRQSGGTGLGLAIAERIVHLHGGTVRASNASEGGLTVEMRLPAEV